MLQDLVQKITASLDKLVTLEIITAVGSVGPKGEGDNNWPDVANMTNPQMIVSKMNLLDGDIQTIFGEAFVTGDYKSLQGYHAEREKQGHAVIQSNIDTLKSLLQLARSLDEQK